MAEDRGDVTRLDAAMQTPREPLEAQLAALRMRLEAQIAELRAQVEALDHRRAHEQIITRAGSDPEADVPRRRPPNSVTDTPPGHDTAHADRPTYFREDWLRYTVTDMPPKSGSVHGLLLVVDDGRPLIYRYLQIVKVGELGGHDQVLIANGSTDFTTDKGQEFALKAFRGAAGNG